MANQGEVVGINIGAEGGRPLHAVDEVEAIPGKGLEGDRYAEKSGTYSQREGARRQLTLIESEAIESVARDYGIKLNPWDTRRNIVTRGVALNHLVGKTFQVGEVEVRALQLCEPCRHLESLTQKGVRRAFVHRGGLNAEILTTGRIKVGDPIHIPS
ncbi:MAG TPA: MOSC domain-containing protein [Actinomycetota bacterium]|nr:MOSC domain-containing protein [Actinomycetota bacterium]